VDYDGRGAPDPAALAARVIPALQDLPLTLLLEPGRSLAGPAGVLLTRVLGVKQGRRRSFVVVDAGMNDLLRPALYESHHHVEPVVSHGRAPRRVDVVGPLCETADFLARDRELERVDTDELLVVRDVGAYGYSMSSTYNMRPRPAEILVEDHGLRLIRRRETFEDLIDAEV
jgi:diaminopimelate decarboxylase